MLTSLIKPQPKNPIESPEEILDSTALTLFYPDAQRTFHGNPGSSVLYASKRYGDITLRLVDPEGRDERWLFAHHLWNSSVLLAELISDEAAGAEREDPGSRDNFAEDGAGNDLDTDRENKSRWADKSSNRMDLDLRASGRWSVKGERVLELGAGA